MFKGKVILISAKLLLFLFIIELSSPVFASSINLPVGTILQLELGETISSENAVVGQKVSFKVLNEIRRSGFVLIRGGSIATGEVITVDKNGALGKPGTIGIQLKSVTAVDGAVIPISASKVLTGESKQTEALIVTLLLCIFGLFIKGENATLQAGSIFEATTISDANINVEKAKSEKPYISQKEDEINTNDLSKLFGEKEPLYIEIKNIVKQYMLIYKTTDINMNVGDEFPIVRQIGQDIYSPNFKDIGIATVLKIKDNKVALKFKLYDNKELIKKSDKIEYR